MQNAFASLLKSKRFWLAVVGVAQIVALSYFHIDEKIWQAIAALIGVLIAAYTVEDTAAAAKTGDKS